MRALSVLLTLVFLSLSVPSAAQTPGDCAPGSAEGFLDVSGVQAMVRNNGSLFLNEQTGGFYEAPIGSGASPAYTAGLWVGGRQDDVLRVAGARYDNFEFWPGPLDDDGTLPDDDCSAYDRIWVVSAFDLAAYDEGGAPTDDILEWPILLGAPVIASPNNGFDDDGDGLFDEGTDGIDNDDDGRTDEHDEQELVVPEVRQAAGRPVYDLPSGDRPEVLGTQTAFWVMNDAGNEHLDTGTPPIGLEVRVSAFAIGINDDSLYPATFYRYTLVKKTPGDLDDAYVSLFLDPDVGGSSDDYVGSDPARSLGFAYNADPEDDVYGNRPPAVGFDLYRILVDADNDGEQDDALPAHPIMVFNNGSTGQPTSDPQDGQGYYNYMQGRWSDGMPLTEGGDGYESGGPVVPFAFPGAPEDDAFWSEVNADSEGNSNASGDRRLVVSAGPFRMFSGETYTLDAGLLFAQGDDHLNSVAALRTVSDDAQALYDEDALFAPFDPPPPITLSVPALIAPADGSVFTDTTPTLTWTEVPGALIYRVELSTTSGFEEPRALFSLEPTLALSDDIFPSNEVTTYYWRVRAERYGSFGSFPPARTFTHYRYSFDQFGFGAGIIEVAYPGSDPCPDANDPGCTSGYPGNTVWLDRSSSSDYVITNSDNDFGDLLRDRETIQGDNFEMRFTETCTSPGTCLGIYSDNVPGGNDLITSVPFELWNTGSEDIVEDDIRMVPILRTPSGDDPIINWQDAYTSTQDVVVGSNTLELGVTHRVLWMMPDRPNGYALFEAAANGFGGAGATYAPDSDGDDQIDPGPDGDDCRSQDYYVDFCYRGGNSRLVAPIGGIDGMQLADLAGDGTTPPVGTLIRFDANERLLPVGAEDEVPTQPLGFALGAAYPNPFRSSTTVPFETGKAGRVRLAVVDVLGREVAVLAEGELSTGSHRAVLDGSRLASGIYLVVLEADGRRQATKVLLLR